MARHKEQEPAAYCECCEQPIIEGDRVIRDNRYKTVKALICFNCFEDVDKSTLVEWLGGTFEDAFKE